MSCFAQSGAATPTIGSIGSPIERVRNRTRLDDARSSHRRSSMFGSVFSSVEIVLTVTIAMIELSRLVLAVICCEIGDLAGLPLLL
jgi:hypothetical protein